MIRKMHLLQLARGGGGEWGGGRTIRSQCCFHGSGSTERATPQASNWAFILICARI